jgi:hypothetical protein
VVFLAPPVFWFFGPVSGPPVFWFWDPKFGLRVCCRVAERTNLVRSAAKQSSQVSRVRIRDGLKNFRSANEWSDFKRSNRLKEAIELDWGLLDYVL